MLMIIGLILLGIILLVLEIIVLPGMIAGIIGGLFIMIGIFEAYSELGTAGGHITFISTFVVTFLAIAGSLKSKAWNRYGLKETIDGKVNDVTLLHLNEGDQGSAMSALRPSGTVIINNIKVEGQSSGEFIDAGTEIVITKVLPNKVMVKTKVAAIIS